MPLSNERRDQIARILLLNKIRTEGIRIVPSEVKREIKNLSTRVEIPVPELGEFFEYILDYLAQATRREIRLMKQNKDQVENNNHGCDDHHHGH